MHNKHYEKKKNVYRLKRPTKRNFPANGRVNLKGEWRFVAACCPVRKNNKIIQAFKRQYIIYTLQYSTGYAVANQVTSCRVKYWPKSTTIPAKVSTVSPALCRRIE